jgi:hypothetical protein
MADQPVTRSMLAGCKARPNSRYWRATESPLLPVVPEGLAFGAAMREAGQEMLAEVVRGTKNLVPGEHGFDGLGVAGGNPKALGVFSRT